MLDSNGYWSSRYENYDFTVNRTTGVVTFSTAPGVSPIQGQDNVLIHAYKDFEGYPERIADCTVTTTYSVNGSQNIPIFGGNPNYRNSVWYNEPGKEKYIPDTNYILVGSEESMVGGLGVTSGYLTVIKDKYEPRSKIYFYKTVTLDSGMTTFRNESVANGEPILAPNSIAYINGEMLYLSENGIYAITLQANTSERVAMKRSYYLDGRLNKESIDDRKMQLLPLTTECICC